jgi:hypothetical protein
MPRSRPVGGIANRGDAVRLAIAGTEFVNPCCAQDPRVQDSYAAWYRARALTSLVAQMRAHPEDIDALHALGPALGSATDADNLAWGSRLVADELRLPYVWLGPLLIVQFGHWTLEAATGAPCERTALVIPDNIAQPRGRTPRLKADQIREAVHWFYRTRVKDPRDKVSDVAAEYMRASGRRTEAHSHIISSVEQAQALLDLIVLV